MSWTEGVLSVLAAGLVAYIAYMRAQARRSRAPAPSPVRSAQPASDDLSGLAAAADEFARRAAAPQDLLANDAFQAGVGLLARGELSTGALLDYVAGANPMLGCMAAEALARRRDATDIVDPLLRRLSTVPYWVRYFGLRAIRARATGPVVAHVIVGIQPEFWTEPPAHAMLRDFVAKRVAEGEIPVFGHRLHDVEGDRAEMLDRLLRDLVDVLPPDTIDELERWRGERIDRGFLNSFGRVWEPRSAADPPGPVMLEAGRQRVSALTNLLAAERAPSVLVVGEAGVGKSTLMHAVASELQSMGWTVFEAGSAAVMADQSRVGELEGRLQRLIRQISGRRVLWLIPNFHELAWAGRHQLSPVSLLDLLLPSVESRAVRILGDTHPQAHAVLLQANPKVRTAFTSYKVEALGEADTLELAARWAARHPTVDGMPAIADAALREVAQLARQYLAGRAAPGRLLHLLHATHRRLTGAAAAASRSMTVDDVLASLSELTGIPIAILDDRTALNLEALRGLFERRVLGQPEAVGCLVDRVAMIKAGLTDPSRPLGVFLFVGPTGTGKTEIAKTLAEFLFGSEDRLVRLDMSELQTGESLDRILGGIGESASGTSLVTAIRTEPFSVVLLDEFEKAHPLVSNLFLQVFDDGRLTDRRGNLADFRQCVVIMTSNLGASGSGSASIGFTHDGARFSAGQVERALAQAFAPEFRNRIDRIVVFDPLSRRVMREILRKELAAVLSRRGLRSRSWAVEWDDSAIDLLLDRGFTTDLGARPLKRAIERYVLAPLAMTIVMRQAPEGDQFLFVRADGDRIDVTFVDPDAADPAPVEARVEVRESDRDRVKVIALDAAGTATETDVLEAEYLRLRTLLGATTWQARKRDALARLKDPGFWNSPQRFPTLGLVECADRIEAGLDGAGSLLRRLRGPRPGQRSRFPRELVQRLAVQLYLIDVACGSLEASRPTDAFLAVTASRDSAANHALADTFAARLGRMYTRWAQARRMRLEVLEEDAGTEAAPYRLVLGVAGFGAFVILEPESGLHVLETPHDDRSFHRAKARVSVAPQPDTPPGPGVDAARRLAASALAATESPDPVIVRRYREEPSPLVRDSVRKWRTGRIDLVMDGHFDLIVS